MQLTVDSEWTALYNESLAKELTATGCGVGHWFRRYLKGGFILEKRKKIRPIGDHYLLQPNGDSIWFISKYCILGSNLGEVVAFVSYI